MAIDNTPPRLRLIVTIATIVVITLVSLEFVFKSYFAKGLRPALIEPKPSEDLAPMTGWSKMPKQPPIAAAPPPDEVHPSITPADDAGAPATDAGAAPHTTLDAGAPRGPAAQKDAGAHR
jgi:hypothetical protein